MWLLQRDSSGILNRQKNKGEDIMDEQKEKKGKIEVKIKCYAVDNIPKIEHTCTYSNITLSQIGMVIMELERTKQQLLKLSNGMHIVKSL